KETYHAYVELHIEQGGILAKEGIPVGVVDGIVSIDDYDVLITGAANHAGTTRMSDRQDALIAAAAVTLAVREVVVSEPGAQAGTGGRLDVVPNAVNVIPGEVQMSIELRDLSSAKLDRLGEKIRARAGVIASETRTRIRMTRAGHHESATAAAEVQRSIESAAGRASAGEAAPPCGEARAGRMMGAPHAVGQS